MMTQSIRKCFTFHPLQVVWLLTLAVLFFSTPLSAQNKFQRIAEDWSVYEEGTIVGRIDTTGDLETKQPKIVLLENGRKVLRYEYAIKEGQRSAVFEAEQAESSGSVPYPDTGASMGRARGSFGETAGDWIQFNNVPAAERLNVHYNNGTGSAKQCSLYINGEKVATLEMEDTGDWYSDFAVVSYHGPVEGTVRLQVDPEDLAANGTTFCCNVDFISLGEPPQKSSAECYLPIGSDWFDEKSEAISLEFNPPDGVFEFHIIDAKGKAYTSQRFIPHETDPLWNQYTVLLADFEPPVTADEIQGGLSELKIVLSARQEDTIEIGNIITARGWPSTPPPGCPVEWSKEFAGLSFTGRHNAYTRADTWYPSWASNGKMYSPYTDGYVSDVFVRSDNPDATTGMGLVEGDDPMNLKVTDLGAYLSRPWPYITRYPCGSLVYNGVWYYGTYILNGDNRPEGMQTFLGPFVGFRYSKDFGKTWTETPCTPLRNLFGEVVTRHPEDAGAEVKRYSKIKMGSPHFVDFGQNMEHSPDGKAYLTAHGNTNMRNPQSWNLGDQVYLTRVRPSIENINDLSKYEFFGGYDDSGKPTWTDSFEEIQPLFDWPGHTGCVTMTYNPGLDKYLMCVSTGPDNAAAFDTYILEADNAAGPWKIISYMEEFGRQAYFVNIPSKFISDDGETMWLCYAANFTGHSDSPRHSKYAMSLREFKLVRK
jgi:hypothetical protein